MRVSRGTTITLVLALCAGCSYLSGCGGGGDDPDGPPPKGDHDAGHSAKSEPDPPQPAFDTWPKQSPAAVLVFSGQTYGYIEPCGCAPETLAGGLGRRHDLLGEIEERGWPVTALDLGTTVRRTRRQSQIKFETVLAAYRDMGYAGMGLGPRDLSLGTDLVYSLHADPKSDTYLPFVSANVTWYGTPDLQGGPHRLLVKEVGEMRVAITGVTVDDGRTSELVASDVTLGDPIEALEAVMPEIERAEADLRVLLAHTKPETARKLLETFETFDVVVCTGPEEPASEPTIVGNSLLFSVGKKGKYVGVVGLWPDAEEDRLRYELVHLDRFRFDETDRMHELMGEYQSKLEAEQIAAIEQPIRHPGDATYVGAKVCGKCHTKAYAKWSGSRHAHAFESLAKGHDPNTEKGAAYPDAQHEWISRVYDPECLACHVTGWDPKDVLRYEGGFLNADFATTDEERPLESLLAGQQCENCHGPGSAHAEIELTYQKDPESVSDDDLRALRRAMDLMVVLDPETDKPLKAVRNERESNMCYRCHDQDNSPKFDFATYWEKVRHPGKD